MKIVLPKGMVREAEHCTAYRIPLLLYRTFTWLLTCWVGAFKGEEASEILKIPNGTRPVALIPLGYASKFPNPRSKRALSEIVHYEVFQAR